MIPSDITEILPVLLKKDLENNQSGQALVDYINNNISEIRAEIDEMFYFNEPVRTPAQFLYLLDQWLQAGITNTDNDYTKRYKIEHAIETHKLRGTWQDHAKIIIDAITGYSAAIITTIDSEDCIEMGGLSTEPDYYWSTERGDDTMDDELGTWEVGLMTEPCVAGNIYIDCHEGVYGSTLSTAEIEQIVEALEDDVSPAYIRIYLCYLTSSSGGINIYTGGVIE